MQTEQGIPTETPPPVEKRRPGRPSQGRDLVPMTIKLPRREHDKLLALASNAGLTPHAYAQRELERRLAHRPGQATRRRLRGG